MTETNLPELNRLDWLDALRGWAVLGVVMVHSGQAARSAGIAQQISAAGQYGVQLFFFISALTISITYEAHIAKFGKSFRTQFSWFLKRFFRIAPLYYIAVIFYTFERYEIYLLSHNKYGQAQNISNIVANILFIHTWIPSANNSVVPGGWSIGVGMCFYVLVPFIWLLSPVRDRIIWLAASAILFLTMTAAVSRMVTGSFYVFDDTYFYYWFPTQAPVMIIGLIFYFLGGLKLQNPKSITHIAVWFTLFLVGSGVAIYFGTGFAILPFVSPTIFALSFMCLIMSLHGYIKKIIVGKIMIFLGKISYSVYIFHFFVLDIARAVLLSFNLEQAWLNNLLLLPVFSVTVVLTSGIAFISKRIIEDPAITYGHKLSQSIAVAGLRVEKSRDPGLAV
jgi:peptidoglycan/LPS O-acetylase OafA/YrhL